MTNEEYSKLIAEIATLTTGGITYKKINGKKYACYQWRENVFNVECRDMWML